MSASPCRTQYKASQPKDFRTSAADPARVTLSRCARTSGRVVCLDPVGPARHGLAEPLSGRRASEPRTSTAAPIGVVAGIPRRGTDATGCLPRAASRPTGAQAGRGHQGCIPTTARRRHPRAGPPGRKRPGRTTPAVAAVTGLTWSAHFSFLSLVGQRRRQSQVLRHRSDRGTTSLGVAQGEAWGRRVLREAGPFAGGLAR
jgi:hypothetical protein